MQKTAFCLFEHSGVFASLYKEKGFNVIPVDLKLGIDIMTFDYKSYRNVHTIIAHPPCTEFAGSGARWWSDKPKYKLDEAISLVEKTIEIIEYHNPDVFFIENPVGRIVKCVPKLKSYQKYMFNPYEFAGYSDDTEAYSKKTCLYGRFNLPQKKTLPNVLGSKMWKLGWVTPEVKEYRSITPLGFAIAFVNANTGNVSYQLDFKF